MRMVLRNILEKNGHEVVAEAENGTVGVVKYKQFHPNVVTMDFTMPVMGGLSGAKSFIVKPF